MDSWKRQGREVCAVIESLMMHAKVRTPDREIVRPRSRSDVDPQDTLDVGAALNDASSRNVRIEDRAPQQLVGDHAYPVPLEPRGQPKVVEPTGLALTSYEVKGRLKQRL